MVFLGILGNDYETLTLAGHKCRRPGPWSSGQHQLCQHTLAPVLWRTCNGTVASNPAPLIRHALPQTKYILAIERSWAATSKYEALLTLSALCSCPAERDAAVPGSRRRCWRSGWCWFHSPAKYKTERIARWNRRTFIARPFAFSTPTSTDYPNVLSWEYGPRSEHYYGVYSGMRWN